MSKHIRSMEVCVGNRTETVDFGDRSVVGLRGGMVEVDTILFTLERFLALDFGSFYNDIDSKLGVKYENINIGTSSIVYSEGSSYYLDGKLTSIGEMPSIHCIRYVNGNIIRSFLISDKSNQEEIGIDMSHFNSIIPDSKWQRIEILVNGLLEYSFVNIDFKSRSLVFDFDSRPDEWSEEGIEVVYLLVSESMLTPEGYSRVILLSDMEILTYDQLQKLVDVLRGISRNELIVYSHSN